MAAQSLWNYIEHHDINIFIVGVWTLTKLILPNVFACMHVYMSHSLIYVRVVKWFCKQSSHWKPYVDMYVMYYLYIM